MEGIGRNVIGYFNRKWYNKMDPSCMRTMISRLNFITSIKREAYAINITIPQIECNMQYL